MEIREILKSLREKHHLTQKQLAERVMVTRQAVSRWENGETQPNSDTLELLSKEFNVSINTLLGSPRILVCKCCGMLLNEDDLISHEPDGSFNENYCKWCYADGKLLEESEDNKEDENTDFFYEALLSSVENIIPQEDDWFAPLIGDWDFDYYDGLENEEPRHVVGEWIFRKILEGSIVEDMFICPSRKERKIHPQDDGEYGVAIRKYNFEEHCYNMVYSTKDYMIHVDWKKEGDYLVGYVVEIPSNRFIFSDMDDNTFQWTNIEVLENGKIKTLSKIIARRKK